MSVLNIGVGEEKICTYCDGKGYRCGGTVLPNGRITDEHKLHCYQCNGQGKWTWWNKPPQEKNR